MTDPIEAFDPHKKGKASGSNQKHSAAEADNPGPGPSVEIEIPPPLFEQHQPTDKEEYALNKKRYRIEKFTLLVVSIYAGIAAFQLHQMIRQNNLTEDAVSQTRRAAQAAINANEIARSNFRQDQRPYIWIASDVMKDPILMGAVNESRGRIAWNLPYTNYGRSPAHNVRVIIRIYHGDNALARKRILPGTIANVPAGTPVPPTQKNFVSVVSPEIVSVQEFQRLLGLSYALVIFGRITYSDAYGGEYETAFCLFRFNSGAHSFCPNLEDNYIK